MWLIFLEEIVSTKLCHRFCTMPNLPFAYFYDPLECVWIEDLGGEGR